MTLDKRTQAQVNELAKPGRQPASQDLGHELANDMDQGNRPELLASGDLGRSKSRAWLMPCRLLVSWHHKASKTRMISV
jgi:hypothetical protein